MPTTTSNSVGMSPRAAAIQRLHAVAPDPPQRAAVFCSDEKIQKGKTVIRTQLIAAPIVSSGLDPGTGWRAAKMSLTRRSSRHTEVSKVLSPKQKLQYVALVILWVLVNVYFWAWWLQPAHAGNLWLYVPVTLSIFYGFTLLPSMYLFCLGNMRRPVHVEPSEVEPGRIGRVAVITLTVPGSESLGIVRRQMLAMREISFPHDNWILVDKEHSPQIQQMAEELGIRYFCRHDEGTWGRERVEAWNQAGPRIFSAAAFSPFQTKTKAGNVNAWLDAYGEGYTHFTQLDIDHNPVPDYLDRVLGFFRNKRVAWVQAPSVYGNHEHWTARGSSEQEFVLQGRSRWASSACAGPRSSSAAIALTTWLRSGKSAASSPPGLRTTWTPWCWPRKATKAYSCRK